MSIISITILVAAVFNLGILILIQRSARPDNETWWATVVGVGAILWLCSMAVIAEARDISSVLWATRATWLGSGIAHPAVYFFLRSLLGKNSEKPSFVAAVYFAAAIATLPSVFGPYIVDSVVIEAGALKFEYGYWIAVGMSFHVMMLIASGRYILREWQNSPWSSRNRLLVLISSLFPYVVVVILVNTILIALTDKPLYFVAPTLSFIPAIGFLWTFQHERLPDVFGYIGKLFPNVRSRFLDSLDNLADQLGSFGSPDLAVAELSSLLGSRVAFSGTEIEGSVMGPESGTRLWIDEKGWERLYASDDPGRIEKIADKLSSDLDASVDGFGIPVVTAWPESADIASPLAEPWLQAESGNLGLALRAFRSLQGGTGVVLRLSDSIPIETETLAAIANRSEVFRLRYPWNSEIARTQAILLRQRVETPQDTLLVIDVHTSEVMSEFEEALANELEAGVKFVGLLDASANLGSNPGHFGIPALDVYDYEWLKVPRRLDSFEDISMFIDKTLLDLEDCYGQEFSISPEERLVYCEKPWSGDAEQLRAMIERSVLQQMADASRHLPVPTISKV